ASPPSQWYRLKKLLHRNKGSAIAATVILFSLVGGIAGTTLGLVRAERARQAEVAQRQIAETKEQEAVAEKAKALAAADQERQARVREAEQRQLAEERKQQAEANEKRAVAEKQIAE